MTKRPARTAATPEPAVQIASPTSGSSLPSQREHAVPNNTLAPPAKSEDADTWFKKSTITTTIVTCMLTAIATSWVAQLQIRRSFENWILQQHYVETQDFAKQKRDLVLGLSEAMLSLREAMIARHDSLVSMHVAKAAGGIEEGDEFKDLLRSAESARAAERQAAIHLEARIVAGMMLYDDPATRERLGSFANYVEFKVLMTGSEPDHYTRIQEALPKGPASTEQETKAIALREFDAPWFTERVRGLYDQWREACKAISTAPNNDHLGAQP